MEFSPTFLYIKQHAITGKLYFGKTTKQDPLEYNGSGKHWSHHIKHHGKEHVITLWCELFEDKDDLVNFALYFSKELNIVESNSWLNLKEENGLDGGGLGNFKKGHTMSEETKLKIKNYFTGKPRTQATKDKMSASTKGRAGKPNSPETRLKISKSNKGRPGSFKGKSHSKETRLKMSLNLIVCPYCQLVGNISAMKRWHFDNCKLVPSTAK